MENSTDFASTKEFFDLQKDFEKTFKYLRIDREVDKDWHRRGYFYQNGETNNAFKAFLHGYQLGRLNYMH